MLVGRNIICFAGAKASSAKDQEQIMELLARDNCVLWVDSSLGPRGFFSGPTKIEANRWRVKPVAVPKSTGTARRVCLKIARRQLQRWLRTIGFRKSISWVFTPELAELVGTLGESLVICHRLQTDTLNGRSAAEQALLRRADLVIVTSSEELAANQTVNPSIHLVNRGMAEAWDAVVGRIGELAAGVRPAEANLAQRVQELAAFRNLRLEFVRHFLGRHSEFFEYQVAGEPQRARVLVKRIVRFRDPTQAERLIRHEHDSLERFQARIGPALGTSIPAPLGAMPEAWALAMTKMPGIPLSAILKREANRLTGFLHREKLRALAGQVGQWLRKFQEATQGEPVTFEPELILPDMRRRLERSTEHGLSAELSERIWTEVKRACETLRGRKVLTGAKHGDFIPQNILVAEGRIAVVDFEDSNECDCVYEDAGTLLAYLLLLEGSPAYSRRAISGMRQSFLEAYGISRPDAFLTLYTLKAAIKTISEFDRRKGNLRNDTRFARMREQGLRMCEKLHEIN